MVLGTTSVINKNQSRSVVPLCECLPFAKVIPVGHSVTVLGHPV